MLIGIFTFYIIGCLLSLILEYSLSRITDDDKLSCLTYAASVCWLSWLSVVISIYDWSQINEE